MRGKNLTEKRSDEAGYRSLQITGILWAASHHPQDIKPENIFVSRFGDFKLGDFGIARELEKNHEYPFQKGTYSYMAPEMYREHSTTAEWTFMHLAWCYIN